MSEQATLSPQPPETSEPGAEPAVEVRRRAGLPLLAGQLVAGVLALMAGVLLGDVLLTRWIAWTASVADRVGPLDEAYHRRLAKLATRGPDDAPTVLVYAWDPTQPATTQRLRWLANYAEQLPDAPVFAHLDDARNRSAVRLVRLTVAQGEASADLVAGLAALERRDTLWPWLLGDALPQGPLTVADLASHVARRERDARLWERDREDSDVQLTSRMDAHIASGLGLQAGDIAINGVVLRDAVARDQGSLGQALHEQAVALAGAMTETAAVADLHRKLQRAAGVEELPQVRWAAWILAGERLTTRSGDDSAN